MNIVIKNRVIGLTKIKVKQFLYNAFPAYVVNTKFLPIWRKYYWWRKFKISKYQNKKIADAIVRSRKFIKLELGSSKRQGMEDWVASDINGGGDIQLDLTQPIPFPDNSIDRIYSSHVLEHFSYPRPMIDLLKECYRILKPGGSLSIAVPNARIFINAYLYPQEFDKKKYCEHDVGLSYKSKIDYINFVAYNGCEHKHMFDKENLKIILEEAGFHQVRLRDFDPTIDLQYRRHESIYADAIKK